MAQSLWNKTIKWSKLKSVIEQSTLKFARTDIRSPLVSAVAYMSIDIPFDLVVDFNGSDLIVGVQVSPSANFERETDKQIIPAHVLFHWLDKGTKVKHIKFIGPYDDVQAGSGANMDSDEIRILASQKYSLPGIEGKEWTETIAEQARKSFPKHIQQTIKSFIGGN